LVRFILLAGLFLVKNSEESW